MQSRKQARRHVWCTWKTSTSSGTTAGVEVCPAWVDGFVARACVVRDDRGSPQDKGLSRLVLLSNVTSRQRPDVMARVASNALARVASNALVLCSAIGVGVLGCCLHIELSLRTCATGHSAGLGCCLVLQLQLVLRCRLLVVGAGHMEAEACRS